MADRPTADAWRALPATERATWLRWLRSYGRNSTRAAMADALESLEPAADALKSLEPEP